METKAIYAVSGDPWTKGHTDIVKRALEIFDQVIVAIGVNPKKNYAFPLYVRKAMAECSLEKLNTPWATRVEVTSFEGLLVDYAYMRGIKTLIRGIRDDIDFNFERSMFQVNITQKGIDEIFLLPSPQYEHISSSAVRELQKNQGNITEYVDLRVKQAMEVRLSDQRIVGITGAIGAGKSYMAERLCDAGRKLYPSMGFHNIELDAIGKSLLTENTLPFALEMRQSLIEELGEHLMINRQDEHCFINVKELSMAIFGDKESLDVYNKYSEGPILFEMQQRLRGKTGLIFINSALLIEAKATALCNNNLIIVSADNAFRMESLRKRGYSLGEADARMHAQMNQTHKIETFRRILEEDPGNLVIIENAFGRDTNIILEGYLKTIFHMAAGI